MGFDLNGGTIQDAWESLNLKNFAIISLYLALIVQQKEAVAVQLKGNCPLRQARKGGQ